MEFVECNDVLLVICGRILNLVKDLGEAGGEGVLDRIYAPWHIGVQTARSTTVHGRVRGHVRRDVNRQMPGVVLMSATDS